MEVILQAIVLLAFLTLASSIDREDVGSSKTTPGLGYRVELRQIDSIAGPLTKTKRLQKALRRSKMRAKCLSSKQSEGVSSSTFSREGEYMMEIKLGTPPRSFYAMLDTGSDLVWVNCNVRSPSLPSSSSSYQALPCNSSNCIDMSSSQSPRCNQTCKYKYEYGDGSKTSGDVAYDTLTLGTGDMHALKFMFGCARKLQGDWNFTQGVVGLGRKSHSLIGQLGRALGYGFSYCFSSDRNVTSPLFLGSTVRLTSQSVLTTPILQHLDQTLYHVGLTGITIGADEVTIANSSLDEFLVNKTVIDSGTTYSLLTPAVYEALKKSLQDQVLLPVVEHDNLDLCFNKTEDTDYEFPSVTLRFGDDGELVLPFDNVFQDVVHGVVCLTMDSSSGDLTIIGNIQQQNFHIIYNLYMSQISFQHAKCDTL